MEIVPKLGYYCTPVQISPTVIERQPIADSAMNIARIIPLLAFLTLAVHAYGRDVSDFTEQHFTSDNGLPQNSVMQLRMDKNGFIWMTTQGGLVRFDGTRFVTYNLSNVPGLISNRIIDLGLTGDSTVFFKDTSFKVFSFDKNNQPFLLNPHIRNRYVILQSPGDQFDVIRNLIPGDRRRVESLFAAFAAQVIYNRIGARGDGFLRIGDNLLLYFYQKKIISFKTFEYGAAMAYDNAGVLGKKMYFLNEKKQLAGIDSSGREYAVFLRLPGRDHPELSGPSHLFQQGERLFLHDSNTFYELKPESGNALVGEPVLKTKDVGRVACYLNIPEKGIHMLGTETGGLYIFRKKQFKTVRIAGTNNNFYSQHLYRNNGLITGLGAILPAGTITGEPFPLTDRSGILVDKEGYIWLNARTGKIEKRTADLKLVQQFDVEREAAKFAQTADGTIWVNLVSGKMGKISGDSIQWMKLAKGGYRFCAGQRQGVFCLEWPRRLPAGDFKAGLARNPGIERKGSPDILFRQAENALGRNLRTGVLRHPERQNECVAARPERLPAGRACISGRPEGLYVDEHQPWPFQMQDAGPLRLPRRQIGQRFLLLLR
ncbi:two-component regulator propeller domain-containing protein [Dyadobacter sp. 676]|uniref:Two-component regulator propeller domain-containing protein n=1 Tax=Dyadobacter sp. 676 TaxID=3088362 RepID=A0AAU8FMD5_9BACT